MSMLIVANRIHGFNFSGPDRFDLLSALIENIGQLFRHSSHLSEAKDLKRVFNEPSLQILILRINKIRKTMKKDEIIKFS